MLDVSVDLLGGRRFLCSSEEEGTILLTQTDLKLRESMADGGRNERQMEKSLPTCLSSSRSVCVWGGIFLPRG